jgi:hypothetical protein
MHTHAKGVSFCFPGGALKPACRGG